MSDTPKLFLDRPTVSPPDKVPSLRYPRLANVTIQRRGAETTIDLYYWTSKHRHGSLMHIHVGKGDDCWIKESGMRRHDLDPLPTFAPWLFQYLWENPWEKPPRPYTDIVTGSFSLTADDHRISKTLRDELSRVVRPVIAELLAENEAIHAFAPPIEPAPITLMLVRSKESDAKP